MPASAPSTTENEPLDISSLSADAKSRFESERIDVVDSDTNQSSYAFMKRDGEVTAEQFVQSYHDVTREKEIDAVTHANPGTPMVAVGVLAVVGGAIGGLALLGVSAQTQTVCTDLPAVGQYCRDEGPSQSTQATLDLVGLGLTAFGIAGAALVLSGLHANRVGHELSRDQAEHFVRRYNGALLHRVLESPEPGVAGPGEMPMDSR